MKQQILSLFLLFLLPITLTLAQHSPTQSPARALAPTAQPASSPPRRAPANVTKILEKAGRYSFFIGLLTSTSVENRLNVSDKGLTVFSPTNRAFSALKPGTLSALSAQQKAQLVRYHFLASHVSLQNFQTLTNPVRTQARDNDMRDYFPLNVTVEGSLVNVSTGMVNATVSATIYDDSDRLAVYEVDKVLLPLGIFAPKPDLNRTAGTAAPSPAPALTVRPGEFPATAMVSPDIAALLNDASAEFMGGIGDIGVANGVVFSFGLAVFGAVLSILV